MTHQPIPPKAIPAAFLHEPTAPRAPRSGAPKPSHLRGLFVWRNPDLQGHVPLWVEGGPLEYRPHYIQLKNGTWKMDTRYAPQEGINY